MNILLFTINEDFRAHSLVGLWSGLTGLAMPSTNLVLAQGTRTLYPGGGVLPYIGYIGMCRCEGYGFQAG